ncbi:hemin-degrading factor [Falsiroseomonas ponticola]|uniref:hemin-degrading factor n=1 Tax=Falsiroseomonas ponticola TaxID=2786951 RepID=UPI001931800E|nr:ChuX/HutX family heme-like substrate-binding protein [Roseomonas ponticola]
MTELAERYRDLQRSTPHLRARDAALRLGTTEAALVASGATGAATPLRPDWAGLIGALPRAGEVMALTRNDHAVHERHGTYTDVSSGPGHIMVLGPDIDLRLFPQRWAHAYALGGDRPSIQVFDRDGLAMHKVFATSATDHAGWQGIMADFALAEAPLPPEAATAPEPPEAEREVDAAALRQAWLGLRDTHDFFPMLRQHRATRRQAFRLAGDDLALRLDPGAGAAALRLAAEREVPVMVFVGNRGAIQIHTGTVSTLRDVHGWFNVLDPRFNLHLREAGVAAAWRVVKPTEDGVVTSIELLDAAGEVVALLFGARKPGKPELESWRGLVADIADHHAAAAGVAA